VGVDHGGLEVPVAEEFLHGANIVAVFEQARGRRRLKTSRRPTERSSAR
jgi:predicted protein tyrosine phosphatase